MNHRASLIGISNLETKQYRHDSPLNSMVERFPEKFVNYNSNKRQDKTDSVGSREPSPRMQSVVVDNVLPALSQPDPSMRFLKGMFRADFAETSKAEISPDRLRER
jgi:hypothetical protein